MSTTVRRLAVIGCHAASARFFFGGYTHFSMAEGMLAANASMAGLAGSSPARMIERGRTRPFFAPTSIEPTGTSTWIAEYVWLPVRFEEDDRAIIQWHDEWRLEDFNLRLRPTNLGGTMAPRRLRAIIDSDAKNEADDQFAIVQALLSPSIDLRGLIAAHFGTHRTETSMLESRDEIDLLLRLSNFGSQVRVENGAPAALPDESTAVDSPGARLIIEESKLASTDDKLHVAFLGPLTDMASALLLDPELANRPVVVIWIGGLPYDDRHPWPGVEFNLGNDIAAANVVFDSGVEIWQVPCNVYSQVSVSYAELEDEIGGTSELADYLIQQMIEWNERYWPEPIESRSLGDSPAISLMLYRHGGDFFDQPAPRFADDGKYTAGSGHPVRVVERLDVRFLVGDLFAKLRRFGRTHPPQRAR